MIRSRQTPTNINFLIAFPPFSLSKSIVASYTAKASHHHLLSLEFLPQVFRGRGSELAFPNPEIYTLLC
jgi:hypothetical protein